MLTGVANQIDEALRERLAILPWEEVLLELLSIPSVSGQEQQVALTLERHLAQKFPNANIYRQSVDAERWNIIMTKGDPHVTLTTHIDTVPEGPLPSVTEELIYGRGSCDAKGQVIAQLWGLSLAIDQGLQDYRCAFVVGEETDAAGARRFLEAPTTPYILNGEPTENRFVRRGWGVVELELTAHGISAHSSLGTKNSAIHILVEELNTLLREQPEDISLNVGMIRGGVAANIQAPIASCEVCARIRADVEPLERHLAERLTKVQWRSKAPPSPGLTFYVPASEVRSGIEVRFATDCSVYAEQYEKVMLFGPGRIEDAHTDNESISRVQLREAAACISGVLLELTPRAQIFPLPIVANDDRDLTLPPEPDDGR